MVDCIVVHRDDSTGTYEIPGAATVEDWDDVVDETKANDGAVHFFGHLLGWDPWESVMRLTVPIGGGWMELYYFVGPVA